MQVLRIVAAAILIVGTGPGGVAAKSLRDAQDPAEFPPASYTGKQYVDSRGCIYVRAGYGDIVTWVPRVSRDRQVICGQQPTFSQTPAAPTVETAAKAPVSVAPVPERSATVVKKPTAPVAAANAPQGPAVRMVRVQPRQTGPAGSGATPSGYKPAWTDGRLNPNRGRGTEAGKAAMDLVWTQTVPRRLIDTATGRRVVVVKRGTTTISTKGTTPRNPAVAPARYVQVGSFGVAANAHKSAARLQKMGFPVRVSRIERGRKEFLVVTAGPFASSGQANAALSVARKSGFRDAFLR